MFRGYLWFEDFLFGANGMRIAFTYVYLVAWLCGYVGGSCVIYGLRYFYFLFVCVSGLMGLCDVSKYMSVCVCVCEGVWW